MITLKHIFLLIGIALLELFSYGHTLPAQPTPVSSTISVQVKSTTTATTTPTKTVVIPKTAEITTKASAVIKKTVPPVVTQPTTNPEPAPDFTQINTFARGAIVNIFCTTLRGDEITGTGVIIDSRGTILTNAHIAEYFLLRDYPTKNFFQCVARTGSPAYPRYNIELVYISPTWVEKNKTILNDAEPKGTGEHDFAFLRITGNVDGSALPTTLSYIKPNTDETITKSAPVILVSYPAGFLGGQSIVRDLNIVSAVTSIADLFTYSETTVDLISVPGTVVSQKGSSGGAVVDGKSTLIGIITTSSNADQTSDRDLRAITLAYINRDLQNELGLSLSQFLSTDLASFAKIFATKNVPALTKLITDELNK